MPSIHHAVIAVIVLFIAGVGRVIVAVPHDLLGLFLAKHCLSWCQKATEGDFAELLLFEELGDIHAHS